MMPEYHIYIGSDHRGFEKKEALFPILSECHENVTVVDKGADEYIEDDDFNEPAIAVAQEIAHDPHSIGVLLCGSGQGVCIQANRVKGARAVRVSNSQEAEIARKHDHANIVCLPADELDIDTMERIIKTFCHTRPLEAEKYARRALRLDADLPAHKDSEEDEEE